MINKFSFLVFSLFILGGCGGGGSAHRGPQALVLDPGGDGASTPSLSNIGAYVLFSALGIANNVTPSVITGNLGVGDAVTSTTVTGLDRQLDTTEDFAISTTNPTQVIGRIYAKDFTGLGPGGNGQTPANITSAEGGMTAAYNDAAGRVNPDFTELGAGDISGMTLSPGLYKWGTQLAINAGGLTLNGGPNDVWIFQIAQNLTLANDVAITLAGGARAKNIFWQVGSDVAIGTNAHFEGIILAGTAVTVNTGSSVNGRIFARTASITLANNVITQP